MLALALWLSAAIAPAAAQDETGDSATPAAVDEAAQPRVVIALLPYGTTLEQLARVGEFAPGLVSAGLGPVPIAQTYLDVSQGNRINDKLYPDELPRLYVRGGSVPEELWERTLERARDAPSQLEPGLLASTLQEAGVEVAVEADSGLATLIAVDEQGAAPTLSAERCRAGCGPGLSVLRARLGELGRMEARLAEGDLLIAIAAGQRTDQQLLPAGFAGSGFESGNLTSSSTRTEGIVSTIDIAATVLDRFGVDAPAAVGGSEITTEGERDAAAVVELQDRLVTRPTRETVVLLPLGIWLVLIAVATAFGRRPAAVAGFRLFGVATSWIPAILLLNELIGLGSLPSALAVGFGAPLLAAAAVRLAGPLRGLALACAISVAAYAIDVVLGSSLTSLSVLGPNPGSGTRFFGIGNELEALLPAMTLIGTGAWLASRREPSGRVCAAWFAGLAALAAAAFAPGRFGADVGAAIVLGVGAATAVAIVLGLGWKRAVLLIAAAGVAGLGALLAIDAVLGGAHLSRSVLGAGEAGDVLDVFERRLRLMVSTFTPPRYPVLFGIAVALLVAGAVQRRTILGWFRGRRAALAGFGAALAGVLVGTVANDSGAILLVLGTIYVSAAASFFWATGSTGAGRSGEAGPARKPAPF